MLKLEKYMYAIDDTKNIATHFLELVIQGKIKDSFDQFEQY